MKNLKRCTAILATVAIFVFGSCKAESDENEGGGNQNAATITTAPAAATVDIEEESTTALVSAGTAEGGTLMYIVTSENTKPTAKDNFSATIPTAENLTAGTYYVWYYIKGDDSHDDSEISATAITVTVKRAAGPTAYTVTVEGGTASLSDGGEVITNATPGETVYISATESEGKVFVGWEVSEGVILGDTAQAKTSFTMISANVTITAIFEDVYTITVTGGIASLSSGGEEVARASTDTRVYIRAVVPEGKQFAGWQVNAGGVSLSDADMPMTSFKMKTSDVTITAQFRDTYTITVVNGTCEMSSAPEGAWVSITANQPEDGMIFDKWTTSSGVEFQNEKQSSTSFTMIAGAVTVTATYKIPVAEIKDHPSFYGDVVFSNGTACSATDSQYLTNEQKADACGVVFNIDNENNKVWVVELSEASKPCAWAAEESEAATTDLRTSENDGAVNLAIFAANPTKFPIYSYITSLGSTGSINGEATGWYIPSHNELMQLNSFMSLVNSVLTNLGATTLTTGQSSGYWSSTEMSATLASCIKFTGMNSLPKTTAVQCRCRAVKVVSTN